MSRTSLVAALGLAWVPAPAVAASATGAAAADVISLIAVRQTRDLDFGVLAANAESAGSVRIAAGGSGAIYSGSARPVCASPTPCLSPHFARFEVSGEANRAYTITAPAQVSVAGEQVGDGLAPRCAPPLVVIDNIQIRSASRPDAGRAGWLNSSGQDSFDLGGTLRLPAATPPARFRISVEVIVTYS